MSSIASELEKRVMTVFDQPHEGTTTLAALPVGSKALVLGFATDLPERTARRLFDLGFLPGAQVQTIYRTPLGDPHVYRLSDYEIALRRSEASDVVVQVLA